MSSISDLAKVLVLAYGTGTWEKNAESLLDDHVAEFWQLIATREDLYDYLLDHGAECSKAYRITEAVRKGVIHRKGRNSLKDAKDYMKELGIPQWYIDSCEKIEYLFPRAHVISYALVLYRLMWFQMKR